VEVVPAMRTKDLPTAFPFVQQDLYNARQPSLFIVDNGNKVFLWQGWWPVNEDIDEVDNRACEIRWHLERYEAMQTTLDYWKAKCGDDDKYRKEAFIVSAGYEPVEFQAIFPEWTVHSDVVEINNQVRQSPCQVLETDLIESNFHFTEHHQRSGPARRILCSIQSVRLST
jgi:supervillin